MDQYSSKSDKSYFAYYGLSWIDLSQQKEKKNKQKRFAICIAGIEEQRKPIKV
jgi:hypothetical protein